MFRNIILVLFLWNCTSNTVFKKPKNLLSKEKMANLIVDLYLAKEIQQYKNKRNIMAFSGADYKVFVFHKYNIDTSQFKSSNFYYNTDIEQYEAIYKMAEKKLKKKYDIFKILDSLRLDSIREIRKTLTKKTIKNQKPKAPQNKISHPKLLENPAHSIPHKAGRHYLKGYPWIKSNEDLMKNDTSPKIPYLQKKAN